MPPGHRNLCNISVIHIRFSKWRMSMVSFGFFRKITRTKTQHSIKKGSNITRIQYFSKLSSYVRINQSVVKFMFLYHLYSLCLLPHNLYQLPLFSAAATSSTNRLCRPLGMGGHAHWPLTSDKVQYYGDPHCCCQSSMEFLRHWMSQTSQLKREVASYGNMCMCPIPFHHFYCCRRC